MSKVEIILEMELWWSQCTLVLWSQFLGNLCPLVLLSIPKEQAWAFLNNKALCRGCKVTYYSLSAVIHSNILERTRKFILFC